MTTRQIICCTTLAAALATRRLAMAFPCLPANHYACCCLPPASQQVSLITFKACDKQQTKCCDYTSLHAVALTLSILQDLIPLLSCHASPFAQGVEERGRVQLSRRECSEHGEICREFLSFFTFESLCRIIIRGERNS